MAIEVLEKEKDTFYLASTFMNIGNLYFSMYQYEKAKEYYKNSQNLFNSINYDDDYLNIILFVNLGNVSQKLEEYKESEKMFLVALKLANKQDYTNFVLSIKNNLGSLYLDSKKYDKAKTYLEEALVLARDSNNKLTETSVLLNISKYYFFTCQNEKALENVILTRKTAIEIKYKKIVHKCDLLLSKIYEVNKEYKKAYKSRVSYEQEKDSIITKSTYKKAISLENKIETFEKQHEINTQKKEIQKLDITIKKKNFRQRNTLRILIILIAALWFVMDRLIKYKKRLKTNKVLYDKLQEKINEINFSKEKKISTYDAKIKDEKIKNILESLLMLEKNSFYTSPNCSLSTVAKEIGTNQNYVSKIVNQHLNKSFKEYINELRIRHIITDKNLKSKLNSYTIKAIGEELGYKSVNTFKSAFKKYTGVTLQYYIKRIHEKTHD